MAQPIIVAGATAESSAAVGPVQVHVARQYSRRAGDVKRDTLGDVKRHAGDVEGGRSKPGDAAVQIILIRTLDFGGDDLADLQRATAGNIDRAVDLRSVGLGAAL
jgi:hypothetical protein